MNENRNIMREDEVEIDLQEIFGVLLQRFWLLAICGLVGGILAFCISFFLITPKYESTTSIYTLNKSNNNNTVTYSDLQLGSQLTKDYAQLITSRNVLETVIETFDLEDSYASLKNRVSVNAVSDTRLIAIKVTDVDADMAQMIANEIRKVAAVCIKEVMDIQAVNVVDEANLPLKPVSPSVSKWTAIGLLLGFMACAAVIVIQFLLDDSIKTGEDIERYLQLSTLAVIPVIEGSGYDHRKKKRAKGKKSGRMTEPDSGAIDLDREYSESARALGDRNVVRPAAGEQSQKAGVTQEPAVKEGGEK